MREMPSISRRQLLAGAGVSAVGLGGYVAGARTADAVPDWLAGRDCDPAALATSETDWPFPRHDRANTGHAPARAGPDWPLERVWTREWPVRELYRIAPLTVADGTVFVAAELDVPAGILAFSLSDGTERWRAGAESVRPEPVVSVGGIAFCRTEVPDTLAVQARAVSDGSLLWERPARSILGVADGRVFVTDPATGDPVRVDAFDAREGHRCWHVEAGDFPVNAVVAGDRLLLLYRDGTLAVETATGEERWRSSYGGNTGVVRDERVVVSRFAGELRSLSLADGDLTWSVTSEHYAENERTSDGDPVARPDFELGGVTENAVVYTLSVVSDFPSRVQARSLDTGELLWDYGRTVERRNGYRYSHPVLVGDEAVVVERPPREVPDSTPALVRLDVTSGEERGRFDLGTERILAPPVVAGGYLLVATGEGLVAYE